MSPATCRTIRTVIQTVVALPAIVSASGIPESLPWVAAALATLPLTPQAPSAYGQRGPLRRSG
ncbi:hypothetical protein RB200_37790 [Streptomyces sp. PmtG]